MTDADTPVSSEAPVEAVLREELAQGDVMLGTVGPILGHLVANHDHSLFSDEIISRVRGMLSSISEQLLLVHAQTSDEADPYRFAREYAGDLAMRIGGDIAFLSHCHALAVEFQLAQRLHARSVIDPVLSPLMQSLIASDDVQTASLAMQALTSQARFFQRQKRMKLTLEELPADLFHHAIVSWREFVGDIDERLRGEIETGLRKIYDERSTRLGLLNRLVEQMGGGARAALSISHAGTALFITALASVTDQDRDVVTLSTHERQLARFALALRSTGLSPREVEEQFVHIHPEVQLPEGFADLRADRARAILDASAGWQAG